jgi:pimeloyl-ACP methyl ester carboxylesterase
MSQIYEPSVASTSVRREIRGVDYRVLEWGHPGQPLLVLLHGWADCAASFQFVVDELKKDWFVVAPDWRGFGLSHVRCHSYWFPDYVADLDVLLSIYSPDEPVNLLGHSMGANAAGLYAGIFPERVRSFVNVEGFGMTDSDPGNAPRNFRRWIEQSRTMPSYTTYSNFDELAERILKRSPAMSLDKANYIARQWAERADDGRIVLHADPAHKLPHAVQYRRAEASACWDRVTAPVLLVVGEETDFTAAARSWIDPDESMHPFHGAASEIISGAGHMVHFERPAALARATEAFISALSRGVV